MKLKPTGHAAHRRAVLKSLLTQGIDAPSRTALGNMMRGYKLQGSKPSTGTRAAPRAHLVRAKAGLSMTIDASLDKMIATTLIGGPHTTGVLSSLFGLTPNLTGR